jgi:hypothetical protein
MNSGNTRVYELQPALERMAAIGHLTSLRVCEVLRLNAKGKGIDSWPGRILALDVTAVRIHAHSYHMTWRCGWLHAYEVSVFPCSAIASTNMLRAQP